MSDTLETLSTATVTSHLAQPEPPRAVWGLLDRKERWRLSWRGRLLLAAALLLAGAFLLKNVYPFLATTHRVDADVLVVEGWIHEYAIRVALRNSKAIIMRGFLRRVGQSKEPEVI